MKKVTLVLDDYKIGLIIKSIDLKNVSVISSGELQTTAFLEISKDLLQKLKEKQVKRQFNDAMFKLHLSYPEAYFLYFHLFIGMDAYQGTPEYNHIRRIVGELDKPLHQQADVLMLTA